MVIPICFAGLSHRGTWRNLRLESCALRQQAFASGTWSNKESHLKQYEAFCIYHGAPDFPVLPGVLLRFIALLGRGKGSYTSAANTISSLKWVASQIDIDSVKVFNSPFVSSSLKGLKAQLSRPVHQKLPFSLAHLALIYNSLDLSNVKHLSGWSAMLMAFFGCLRLSNLVPISRSKFDPNKQLKREDIEFNGDLVLVCFKWSKTNQHCKKLTWIPICEVSDPRFSLKFHLVRLFSQVTVPPNAPLFSHSKSCFHSRHSLLGLLNKCLSESRLRVRDFSWHSFRRGAAVFAFDLGLEDSSVQLLGDWSSAAFKTYLEFAFKRKVSVAREIAISFNKEVKRL